MLAELKQVRQVAGEEWRRWFSDDALDLIVWYRDAEISGFQVCYDRRGQPRAFTWTEREGARHDAIDDGEYPGGYKATPILVPHAAFDAAALLRVFNASCASVPGDIADLVRLHLRTAVRP